MRRVWETIAKLFNRKYDGGRHEEIERCGSPVLHMDHRSPSRLMLHSVVDRFLAPAVPSIWGTSFRPKPAVRLWDSAVTF